eukprot:949751-Pleurochrysis_carterae.AAC.1
MAQPEDGRRTHREQRGGDQRTRARSEIARGMKGQMPRNCGQGEWERVANGALRERHGDDKICRDEAAGGQQGSKSRTRRDWTQLFRMRNAQPQEMS